MLQTSENPEPDSASSLAVSQRRFRLSRGDLALGVCILCVLLAAAYYVAQLQPTRAARRAMSHIQRHNPEIVIGSPNNATPEQRADALDPRNTLSVAFRGTTLAESDCEQLAKVSTLTSLTISNASVDLEGLKLLRHLPSLRFLVLENAGVDDSRLKKIKAINPQWRVVTSQAALRVRGR